MERSSFIRNFKPRKFLKGKHIQTIFNVVFPPENPLTSQYYSEDIILYTSDKSGDSLWLEHNPPLDSYRKNSPPFNGYYMILIHGMEGNSDSHYIVTLASSALKRGYGVIRVNLRGCGKGEGFSGLIYNAGKSEDIEEVENFVYKSLSKKIILCGFSLSANMVLKYLGEKNRPRIKYFSAVSPPLDLKSCCEHIDSPRGKFYRDRFLRSFKEKIKKGRVHSNPNTLKHVFETKTMFDFDDIFSAPLAGYRGALEYYRVCSSKNYIYTIKQKGIIIHADDDPLIPKDEFLRLNWEKVPNVTRILTHGGGHVGFMTDKTEDIPDGRWLNYTLIEYFQKLLT
ncbi:MAG: alpha/beta fold hydrolase [Leptospiraceae bacterium]|nr:alpha/beta fold hydrolase [Leptospiraceae bacterium]